MNIRKSIDYSSMFDAMDAVVIANIPQMELYRDLGRIICARPENGAAVAADEYLKSRNKDTSGFSPRNLRRMREFYRVYEGEHELLALAMEIGWTQNVVILEADLSMEERRWYLGAVRQFGWTKVELPRNIETEIHMEVCHDKRDVQRQTTYVLHALRTKLISRWDRLESLLSRRPSCQLYAGWKQYSLLRQVRRLILKPHLRAIHIAEIRRALLPQHYWPYQRGSPTVRCG